MAYGTAPHRVAPGVWATQDGRRLTPAGSAYWEHHHQQGLVTTDGHTTQKAKSRAFGAALDPTRSVLPAPPPPRAAPGRPTITRGQWGGMTPKQKMDTQVTVSLSAHDRDRLAKLRGQAPRGKTWAAPIPKVVNVPIGFSGASGIDQHMAAIRAAEQAFAKERRKFDVTVKSGVLSPQKADEAARMNLAHPGGGGGFLSHTGFPAIGHVGSAVGQMAGSALKGLGERAVGSVMEGAWNAQRGAPGGPVEVQALAKAGQGIREAGRMTSENFLLGPNLTGLATGGHWTPGGLGVDVALLLPSLKPIRGARAALRAGRGAVEAAGVAERAAGAVARADIPERVSQAEHWRRLGIDEDQIKAGLKFYDTRAAQHPEGEAAWWRDKIGHPTGQSAKEFDAAAAENTLYQQHPDEEGIGHLYPEGLKVPALGRMPRIKGMTPQLWNLIKRGAAFRDWYERGAGVVARFAERQGITPRQAAAIVAITSQQANPTFNLRRAAEMVNEWKTLGVIDPSTRFAGQAEKVTHVLEHPETFNWDGVKTNNYFANFIHHLDPEFHAKLYGADTQVTVDRHIANMILGKKSVTPAQSDEVGDLFVRTAKSLGWSPKEVQAAAWVPWKAEQMDISEVVKALSRQMKKNGEIPEELLGKGKKTSEARSAFVRAAYESGRRPEGVLPKGWEHYKQTAADAYERGERLYSGEHGGTLYQRPDEVSRLGQAYQALRDEHSAWVEAQQKARYDEMRAADKAAGRDVTGKSVARRKASAADDVMMSPENRVRREAVEQARQAWKDAEEELKQSLLGRGPLRQKTAASDLPKGATQFLKDGKTRVHFFEGADISTLMHELLHVSMTDLKGRHLATLADEFANGKDLAHWTEGEHEAVASAFEQWLRTGEITNPKLTGAFNSIKEWMQQLIGKAKGAGYRVPKDVEDAFNYMFREPPGTSLQEDVVKAAKRAKQEVYPAQEVKRSIERAGRFSAMEEARAEAGGGARGQEAALEKLAGEYHKEPFDDLTHLQADDMEYLINEVGGARKLSGIQKTKLIGALQKANRGEVFTPSDADLVFKAFGPAKGMGKGLTRTQRAMNLLTQIVNIPRSFMSSFDVSGILRQGLMTAVMHPVMAVRLTKPMMKYLFSEQYYLERMARYEKDPRYHVLTTDGGLELTDTGHEWGSEEAYQSQIAETMTGGKYGPIRASGRAYTGLLNDLRWGSATNMFDLALESNMLTPEELKRIGRVSNWATGRGTLGKHEQSAQLMNLFLFSPRLLSSRLQTFNPWFYKGLDPEQRLFFIGWSQRTPAQKQALKATSRLLLAGGSILALAKLAGADIEIDPRSSDFAKIRVGDTRVDIWGGHQAIARTFFQTLARERKITSTGEIRHVNFLDPIFRFFTSKASPPMSLAIDYHNQKTFTGDPFRWGPVWDPKSAIGSRLYPLGIGDTWEAYQQADDKAVAALIYALSTVGLSTQTYPDDQTGGTSSGDTGDWNTTDTGDSGGGDWNTNDTSSSGGTDW